MSRSLIPAQHKLAEKLTILNHRGAGMLTRIYNIKKVLTLADDRLVLVIGTMGGHRNADRLNADGSR